jgi:hypothetical protein
VYRQIFNSHSRACASPTTWRRAEILFWYRNEDVWPGHLSSSGGGHWRPAVQLGAFKSHVFRVSRACVVGHLGRNPRLLRVGSSCIGIIGGLVVLAGATRPAGAAVIVGQIDNFEDGTLQGWTAGATNPNAPTNVATGGPAGANDNYLRLSSNGQSAGGKLVAFSSGAQWSGDYVSAGVGAIRMQVNNQGATALTLRLIFVGVGGQAVGTVADVNVPANSGWTTATFPLTPENLSGGSFAAVMSTVTELDVVHSPTVITVRSSSPNIVGQLGVDNVTAVAVPEPASAAGIAWTATLASRARRRCGRRSGRG